MDAMKLTCSQDANGTCTVDVAVGARADKSPSYTFHTAGTLEFFLPDHWTMFRDTLARGVKRPHALFIEEDAG